MRSRSHAAARSTDPASSTRGSPAEGLAGQQRRAGRGGPLLLVQQDVEVREGREDLPGGEQEGGVRRTLCIGRPSVEEGVDEEEAAGAKAFAKPREQAAVEKVHLDDEVERGLAKTPVVHVGLDKKDGSGLRVGDGRACV